MIRIDFVVTTCPDPARRDWVVVYYWLKATEAATTSRNQSFVELTAIYDQKWNP
jgi:hypothetical protein